MQFSSISLPAVALLLVYFHPHDVLSDCNTAPRVQWSSCGNYEQPILQILKNKTVNEEQLRDACRVVRTAVKCNLQAEYGYHCASKTPSFVPVFDKYIAAVTAWDICEQPDLFTDYRTALPCVKSVEAKIDVFTDPTTVALVQCAMAVEVAYTEVNGQLKHDLNAGTPSDHGQFWLKLCCAIRKFQTCGSGVLRSHNACSGEAVAVVEKLATSFTNAFDCNTLAPTASCPA